MKQDTQKTKVLFLMEQPDSDISANVFAFFPEERYNTIENGTFTCYAHIGQHSACHIDYANKCLQATQEQYNDLKIELEGLGYDLEVLNEQPPAPIKEDAKHTPGELFLDDGDFDRTGEPDELYIRGRLKDELFDVCNFGCNDTGFALDYAAALVTRYNQAPTLLKENEQLKAEIERLRKWAVETIDISQNLAHKRKEQVNVLREALQLLTNSTNLSKLNIRKDFTLINAHANGLKALKKTETN